MRIREQTEGRLLLEDRPVILGLAIGGAVLLTSLLALAIALDDPALGGVFGLIPAVFGLMFALFVRRDTALFDRGRGLVVLSSRSLFGRKRAELPLDRVEGALVEKRIVRNRLSTRPVLTLRNPRERRPLSPVFVGGRGAEKVVEAINAWIGK